MTVGVVAALLAAYGVYLVYTALALRWTGLGLGPAALQRRPPGHRSRWAEAGFGDAEPRALAGGAAAGALAGAVVGFVLFGGVVAPAVAAGFGASLPLAAARDRHRRRVAAAADAWPRMLEELRTLTGAAGRSIPQALFEVGRRAPQEIRPAFARAEREWMLTTDFERTLAVLRELLADATADTVCETLVVAHEVGGGGLDRRLAELIEDRLLDREGRKDAESKQAGVRFARRFVLLVPLGMAVAGLSIGSGRAAYGTAGGQAAVAVGLLAVAACWYWSGRLMRLPTDPRVFATAGEARPEPPGGRS
ncbi:MAG TPA: hypothetical protein VKV25_09900 [Acidimicrobiales bacterium]|nr:hypothetical protein [Acidimicrobiales bacterium]